MARPLAAMAAIVFMVVVVVVVPRILERREAAAPAVMLEMAVLPETPLSRGRLDPRRAAAAADRSLRMQAMGRAAK